MGAGPGWKSITGREAVRAFMAERGTVVKGPHRFTKKVCHWPYCARCGLVLLKNEVTRKAARALCVTEE